MYADPQARVFATQRGVRRGVLKALRVTWRTETHIAGPHPQPTRVSNLRVWGGA